MCSCPLAPYRHNLASDFKLLLCDLSFWMGIKTIHKPEVSLAVLCGGGWDEASFLHTPGGHGSGSMRFYLPLFASDNFESKQERKTVSEPEMGTAFFPKGLDAGNFSSSARNRPRLEVARCCGHPLFPGLPVLPGRLVSGWGGAALPAGFSYCLTHLQLLDFPLHLDSKGTSSSPPRDYCPAATCCLMPVSLAAG